MELDGQGNAKCWGAEGIGEDGLGVQGIGGTLSFFFVSESMCLCACVSVYVCLCVWPLWM